LVIFCFSSRRRHTRSNRDWSSDVCSSDLGVDHSLGLKPFFSVVGAADVDDERLLRAAGVDREVAALAAHAYDAGAVANTVAQRRSEERRVGQGWRTWLVAEHGRPRVQREP